MTPQQSTTTTRRKRSRTSFGSTRKLPSGRWQARFLDAQGNRRTAPETFETKRDADDWLAMIRADLVRGIYRAPDLGTESLADYLGDWLATRTDLAPRTHQLYEYHARDWINRELRSPARSGRTICIGDMELRSITVATVREWYAAAIATQQANAERRSRATRRGPHPARTWARANGWDVSVSGKLSPQVLAEWVAAGSPIGSTPSMEPRRSTSQADISYRLLRAALNSALREGLIVANPCQIRGAGNFRSRERVPATPHQVRQIAAAMPERYSVAVEVAAWSGLRAGELFALARRHIDLDAAAIRVERSVVHLRGEAPRFGPTKTDSSRRTVHLPLSTIQLLAEHLARFTLDGDDALVFSRPDGSILPEYARTSMFTRARLAAGRPDLRWHDLRHTGATLAAHAGASIRDLQSRLGHSTIQAAMLYQHASAERDQELAARLDALARPSGRVSILPTGTNPA